MLAGPEPAGGRLIGWPATGEAEISVEALLEILEAVFEGIAEWRKERAEEGGGAQETVVLGGQQDGSPGNDPYSATGQVASGGNIICFTTGRGSVYGCKPAPCLKLTTNTPLYEKMSEDMDIDCGVLLSGKSSVQKLGQQIFKRVLEVASGSKSKSEEFGFGDNEFVPWRIGAVM